MILFLQKPGDNYEKTKSHDRLRNQAGSDKDGAARA